jgi:hypothetical protein
MQVVEMRLLTVKKVFDVYVGEAVFHTFECVFDVTAQAMDSD